MTKRMIWLSLAASLLASRGAGPALAQEPVVPPPSPVLRYEIWVSLDDGAKMLRGREDIVWNNRSGVPVGDMMFHLYWNAFKNESSAFLEESRAETMFGRGAAPKDGEWGWVDVTDIRLADGPDLRPTMEFVTADEPVHPGDETVMRVRFPQPVEPGGNVRLHLEFQSKIPRTVARSGYYKNSYFIGQWFPKPGVYEPGKGWNCHAYHETSEFFADFADFEVHITVPQGFKVGASGKEEGVETDQSAKTATFTFRQSMIHDFAWMADPRYLKVERDFVGDREVTPAEYEATAAMLGLPVEAVKLPDVKMTLLVAPEHRGQIDRHFRALAAAMKYYGLWYGPYPYGTITMVDPPFRTGSGGMEYPTLFTAGTSLIPSRDVLSPEGVIIHEFGHGYWYGLVANNEFEEAWLDEGINTYSTGRVAARAYGAGAFSPEINGIPLAAVLEMPKTLDFETDRLAAINVVPFDPVVTPSWRFYSAMSYGANVYMRASTCLNTLERFLGETVMARVMRTYHMRWRFRHPTTEDFVAVVNEVSGRDMTWFFDQLFLSTLDFDYGVASCRSVEKPAQVRGVHGAEGKKEEMTSARIRELEAEAAKSKAPSVFVTTVTLRRFGEARLGGDARVKLVVGFEDGSRETREWDGQARWTRLAFTKPAKAAWARIDPDNVWLIDSDLANNSFRAAGAKRGLGGLFARLLFMIQNILQFASSLS